MTSTTQKKQLECYKKVFVDNFNMYKFIQYRNTLRKSYMPLNTDTKLHFINLNLLPIDANKIEVDSQYIYGNNALKYLRLQLKQIPKNEPVFIFSHIGFITLGKWGPDKYWNEQEREEFLNSLDSHTIGGIFCGHVHATGMIDSFGSENVPEKYNKMLKEHQLYHQCVLAGTQRSSLMLI